MDGRAAKASCDPIWTGHGTLRHSSGPIVLYAPAQRQTAIEIAGTYPVYEGLMQQSCLLPTPDSWYERARVSLTNNRYTGFSSFEKIFRISARNHSILCRDQPRPIGPGAVKKLEKHIDMGPGEIYHYQRSRALPGRTNHGSD